MLGFLGVKTREMFNDLLLGTGFGIGAAASSKFDIVFKR